VLLFLLHSQSRNQQLRMNAASRNSDDCQQDLIADQQLTRSL
jgi:hypothetical protein